MYRLLPLTVLLLALSLWAQESDDAPAPDNAEAAAAEGDDVSAQADELDDLDDLDELYPVEDEDEFIPSEDVAFGQSIPFPTDI